METHVIAGWIIVIYLLIVFIVDMIREYRVKTRKNREYRRYKETRTNHP